jgi:hypothetical protein
MYDIPIEKRYILPNRLEGASSDAGKAIFVHQVCTSVQMVAVETTP